MDMFPGAAAFLRGIPVPHFRFRVSVSALGLLGLCGLLAPTAHAAGVSAFQARSWKISNSKSIPYRLFIPKNREAGKKYPVMLALHGAGERGTDNTAPLNQGFLNFWADDSIQKTDPCFVVVPQCPLNEQWVICPPPWDNYDFTKSPITDNMKAVMAILDSLEKEFPVDTEREYVSGMSMGGQGTWYALMAFPERWAAGVPICGSSDPAMARALDKVNIWTFHAADDPTVGVRNTQATVAAIRAVGGSRLKYTEYPASLHYGHESWKPAGRDPQLHRWVFAQTRAQATALLPSRPDELRTNRSSGAAGVLIVDPLGRVRLRANHPVPLFFRRF
jgi:predicted peptidase